MKAKRIKIKPGEKLEAHVRAAGGKFTFICVGPGSVSMVISKKEVTKR